MAETRGRPKIADDLKKTEKCLLSFTLAEYEALRLLAARDGSDLRAWLRQLALDTLSIRKEG